METGCRDPEGRTIDRLRLAQLIAAAQTQSRHRLDPVALRERITQHVVEAIFGSVGDACTQRVSERAGVRAGRLAQHGVDSITEKRAGRLVIQDREAGGHAGLEREALQQPLAKSVDRLDLEPAWRLDGTGKEPSRIRQFFWLRLPAE